VIALKASALEYEFTSDPDNGYRFHVVCTKDPEFGWSASISMMAHGYAAPLDAIEAVARSAHEFIRQYEASPKVAP